MWIFYLKTTFEKHILLHTIMEFLSIVLNEIELSRIKVFK